MSQKIKTSVEIDGSLSASQIANATTDTDKFLVSDGGTIKYRTGAELATDLGISAGTTSKVQHQVKAAVAINKGQAVYVTTSDGTNMIVGLASNASEATSSKTMGLLNATVVANGFADVITEGLLDGLNTIGANAGDPVWLGTGGNLIYGLVNKPYAPNHLVFIGIVTRVNANNGEIFVKVQNGFELDEIHDVDLKTTTKVNGHLLGYNGSLWVNKTIAEWLGYTPYNASNPAGYISSYTETDPTVPSHVKSITTTNISNWNTAYGWGNHALAGYLTSYTETDTLASVTGRGAITSGDIYTPNNGGIFFNGNGVYGSGVFGRNFGQDLGLNAGGLERLSIASNGAVTANVSFRSPIIYDSNDTAYYLDPTSTSNLNALTLAGTFSAPGYNKTNWDTAFGWGNHASAGYALSGHTHDLGRYSLRAPALIDSVTASNFRTQLFGSSTSGYNISTARFNSTPGLLSGLNNYGTMMAWSGSDTHGFLAIDYAGPAAIIGGGNSDNINWTKRLAFLDDTVPNNRTITINGTSYDLSANRSWTVTASETDTLATVVARGDITNGGRPIRLDTSGGGVSIRGSVTGGWATGYYFMGGPSNTYRGGFGALGDGDSLSNYWIGPAYNNFYTYIDASQITHTSSMRSPIFYDSNNTGYYVDPAGNSNLYYASFANDVQMNGNYLRFDQSGTRSWNIRAASGNLNFNSGDGGGTYVFNGATSFSSNSSWFGGYGPGSGPGLSFENQSTFARIVFWGLDFYDWNHGTQMVIDNGYVSANNSFRAPIFYDTNNTGYYVDPASTSSLNVLSMANKIIVGSFPNSTVNNGEAWIGRAADRSAGTMTVQLGGNLDRKFEVVDYGWTTVNFQVNGYGAAEASGSMRAPIFYDSNNTGYYVDGASTSKLNALTLSSLASDDGMIENNTGGYFHLGGWGVGRTAATAVLVNTAYRADIADNATNADTVDGYHGDTFYRNLGFGSGYPSWNLNTVDPDRSGFTYSNGGPWTGPFIHIGASGYGLQFNASYSSNGAGISYRTRNGDTGNWNSWWRIYSDTYRPYADDSGTTSQRSFNYLYASSYLESGGAVYGTIFYDNNNRGYYMDPDGTSQLSSIYTNNWVRVQGDSGVYSQDYGGHLRRPVNASHGTWEIFGYNKNGYAGMNVYDPQGYNNNYMHESGNGGLYQQNGNGWIFYHSRGNACFGVMTSSTSSSYKLYVGGSIYAEGDIVAYSDRRKKENIVTVDNALNTVNKLRGVYYNRIDDDSKKRQIGVIAQEIQEVLPEVVTHAKDVDEYGVSYGNITGLLIEAIKEQQTQIEELKELVNKLISK